MTTTDHNHILITTVIPTTSRPTLARAVRSVLDQDLPEGEIEIIVANDSGHPLPPEEWQASPCVRVIETNRSERCAARNAGAAAARGEYLHLLDDDDWLYPGALWALCRAARSRNAPWVCGSAQLVNRAGQPQMLYGPAFQGNCFAPILTGEWIPVGAFLITKEAFSQAGGFADHTIGMEDMDLYRRIALRTDLVTIDDVIACIGMGGASNLEIQRHTLPLLREAREAVLDDPRAFARLRSSACTTLWRARAVRVYLTSLMWNARRGKAVATARRAACAVRFLTYCAADLPHPAFWREVLDPSGGVSFRRDAGRTAAPRPS